MDLREWGHQFLIRNAKLKGWDVSGTGPEYEVVSNKRQRYRIDEDIKEHNEADVLITLNTKDNIQWASEHFDSLPETRIVFANPDADAYWTLNVRMMRSFGDVERFKKNPKSLSSEVPLVKE